MTRSLRRLLVVLAAVTLLGHGGVELAPRLTSAGATVAAAAAGAPTTSRPASRPASSRPAAESQPVERDVSVRSATASALAPSGGAEPVAGPGSRPLVAQHLRSAPVARPPTPDLPSGVVGAPGSRGPPGAAGT